MDRHIAIDIGVFGMARALAGLLDAPFLSQTYSRLVVDCNRDPASVDAMPALSDGIAIRGNADLDADARAARIAAIHAPYHTAIAALIEARREARLETTLLALHSFTPIMAGIARPWDVGILHWRGRTDFARAMLDALRDDGDLTVGDNAPYVMDATDFTVPTHAFPNALRYAEIEVRQDLLATPAMQTAWAERLARAALKANG